MYFGSAWYPEHWPEQRWATDLKLMRAAGMNVVRVGEFAWSRLEPSEGDYQFDWLERAINLAADLGLVSVVGTPSAAPPAWLTKTYPDVLAVRESGRPEPHGGRCHYSPTSPRYREFCRKIAEVMAKRFGRHPNVIGWQIDNEYWSNSYDPHSMKMFHEWLKRRYGTLENLNDTWANAYWSQDYSDWSQVPAWHGWQNPCLLQAGKEFMTDVYIEFQKVQVNALRAHIAPRQWITHNCHAHPNLDWARIARELDFVSWDPYIGTGHLNPHAMGPILDFARGILRKTFWIMETQPGSVNWAPVNNSLDRGEIRRLAWHHIGHGADAVLFWQWRSAPGGQEQYHGCIVAPDGTPRPVFTEAQEIGKEIAAAAHELDGTQIETDVAMLDSYPDRWAITGQAFHADFKPAEHFNSFYGPLRTAGVDIDIQNPSDDLSSYKLVVAPHLHILTAATAAKLADYVRNGGHLLLGPRSGFKDDHNRLLLSRQPGAELAPLLGAHVADYYALEKPAPVTGTVGHGQASIWAEYLVVTGDAEVLLRYGKSNGWIDNQPALVTRRVGNGRITYLGGWLDRDLMKQVTQWALSQANVTTVNLPEGVELCRRSAADRDVLIVVNHSDTDQTVHLPGLDRQTIAAGDVVIKTRHRS